MNLNVNENVYATTLSSTHIITSLQSDECGVFTILHWLRTVRFSVFGAPLSSFAGLLLLLSVVAMNRQAMEPHFNTNESI